MTTTTTSAGMPPIAPSHHALDVAPIQPTDVRNAGPTMFSGFADEGKTRVAAALDGIVATVRDIADKLDSNGAAPFAGFVHQAADTVSGWSTAVNAKSVDELVGDTRTLVRTNPAIAVGVALAAGFVLSRLVKASNSGRAW
jgi:ElaB/YqjD/DUF883 family membrane-anchored ribosome-binding protein